MATTGFTLLDAVAHGRLPFSGGDHFVLLDVYEEPEARRAGIEPERLAALRDDVPALGYVGAPRGGNTSLPIRASSARPPPSAVYAAPSWA
jgi:hypothetical protein